MARKKMSITSTEQAVRKVLHATLSRAAAHTEHVYILATLALLAANPQPDLIATLGPIVSGIGINAMSSLLQRLSEGERISNLAREVGTIVANSNIETELKNEVVVQALGKVLRSQRHQIIALDQVDKGIAERLSAFTERLQGQLENISLTGDQTLGLVKEIHASVVVGSHETSHSDESFAVQGYAQFMLEAIAERKRRHIPLFAEHREFSMFATRVDDSNGSLVPVARLFSVSPRLILLGESGAGKTDALWKMVVDVCERLIGGGDELIPAKVDLRMWSPNFDLRNLVQGAFASVNASVATVDDLLRQGKCLLLVDGLNEISAGETGGNRTSAKQDIEFFMRNYPNNSFVFSCRTADYDSDMVTWQEQALPIYEIQRLNASQIEDFTQRYFLDDPTLGVKFLHEIGFYSPDQWHHKDSLLHLARIPLHLQVMISTYRDTRTLPRSKGKVIEVLATHMMKQDKRFRVIQVSPETKGRVLGNLTLQAIHAGYYLTLPRSFVEVELMEHINATRADSTLPNGVTAQSLLEELLSNNFLLQVTSRSWENNLEWLHQLIHDYFLGKEIIRVLLLTEGQGTDRQRLRSQLRQHTALFDIPCQMALSLLAPSHGAKLLEMLLQINGELAYRAFGNQDREIAEQLGPRFADLIMNLVENFELSLERVGFHMPFVPIVDSILDRFKRSDDATRRTIAKSMLEVPIRHQGTPAAKIVLDKFESWTANRDEFVKFYAAKGLWGRNPGRAAHALKEILEGGSPEARRLVKDLRQEWGIE